MLSIELQSKTISFFPLEKSKELFYFLTFKGCLRKGMDLKYIMNKMLHISIVSGEQDYFYNSLKSSFVFYNSLIQQV